MAWTAPMTAVANTAFTAAQFNQYVRDNLNETGPAKVSTEGQYLVATGASALTARRMNRNSVNVAESTTSTTFTNLATNGPTMAITTGTTALVIMSAKVQHGTSLGNAFMGYEISGASSNPADEGTSLSHAPGAASGWITASYVLWEIGMTPGSNTFTCKYRTNTGTATYDARRIMVLPF